MMCSGVPADFVKQRQACLNVDLGLLDYIGSWVIAVIAALLKSAFLSQTC